MGGSIRVNCRLVAFFTILFANYMKKCYNEVVKMEVQMNRKLTGILSVLALSAMSFAQAPAAAPAE